MTNGRWATATMKFIAARRGSVAIQIGLLLTVLCGMAALGTEMGLLLWKQRQMQAAADAAAMAATTAFAAGYPADFQVEARAVAGTMGFVHGTDGTNVTAYHPPVSGAYAGDTNAIAVVVSQPQTLYLVSLFRDGLFNVGARAVAFVGNSGIYCMLALHPTASGAIAVSNNAIVTNPLCGVAANSSSRSAMTVSNNGAVNGPVSVHGNWTLSNNAHLYGSPLIHDGPIIADPYANVALQTIPACTSQSGSGKNNVTINVTPGHFCSGWDFSNNVVLNVAAGAYYIDQKMSIKNNVIVNATGGVTFIINGNYAVDIGNNARLNLTAPTTGPYAGLAFFGTRTGTTSVTQVFSNNATLNIQGTIYFPSQTIEIDNNGATTANGCTHVIAQIIEIENNVRLDNNCDATGVLPIGALPPYLVQ